MLCFILKSTPNLVKFERNFHLNVFPLVAVADTASTAIAKSFYL